MMPAAKNLDPNFNIGPDLPLTGWRLHLMGNANPHHCLRICTAKGVCGLVALQGRGGRFSSNVAYGLNTSISLNLRGSLVRKISGAVGIGLAVVGKKE